MSEIFWGESGPLADDKEETDADELGQLDENQWGGVLAGCSGGYCGTSDDIWGALS